MSLGSLTPEPETLTILYSPSDATIRGDSIGKGMKVWYQTD